MSFELVDEIHHFLLNDTFLSNTSLNQKSNIRIQNNKLTRSNDNFFFINKSNY